MDLSTALMMVASSLYQGVESPVGHSAFMDAGDETMGRQMSESVAEAFRELEEWEAQRTDGDGVYDELRQRAGERAQMMAQAGQE